MDEEGKENDSTVCSKALNFAGKTVPSQGNKI